jgi:ubiquinone/menaquinone biosynthesis C-methylase UbiE
MHMNMCRFGDDSARRKWQNPEAILAEIGLKPGMSFMDIGCSGGFFALPAARIVGKTGKVYGVDINDHSIAGLRKTAGKERLDNLELSVERAEEYLPCTNCVDIVFMGIVLHDFQDPATVLANARQIVKPDGKLVNLDWKKEATPIGPPVTRRLAEVTAIRLIENAGFKVESVQNSSRYCYIIIARLLNNNHLPRLEPFDAEPRVLEIGLRLRPVHSLQIV